MMPRDPREDFSLDDEGSAWQGVSTWKDRRKQERLTGVTSKIIRKWGRDADRSREGKRQ